MFPPRPAISRDLDCLATLGVEDQGPLTWEGLKTNQRTVSYSHNSEAAIAQVGL